MQQNHLNTEFVYTHTELASSSVSWSRILPPQPYKSTPPLGGVFVYLLFEEGLDGRGSEWSPRGAPEPSIHGLRPSSLKKPHRGLFRASIPTKPQRESSPSVAALPGGEVGFGCSVISGCGFASYLYNIMCQKALLIIMLLYKNAKND